MRPSVNVSKLEKKNLDQYETFLTECPHALLYHSVRYKDFIKELLDCEECYLVAEERGEIRAALPLMSKEYPRGVLMNSLPYFGSHGSILYLESQGAEALLQAYNEILRAKDLISSTVITNPFAERVEFPFCYNYTDYRIGQFTPLPTGKDEAEVRERLCSNFESSTRRNINKATQSQIEIKVDNSALDTLERLHRANIQGKNGRCKSENFFKLLPKYFRADKDFKVYTALLHGEIVAALLLFYYKETVEYFTPGLNDLHRQLQPLPLIVFEAMVEAATRGFTLWNWGGTWQSQEGVYRFKKKWGSIEKKYSYYTKLNSKELLDLSSSELSEEFPDFYVLPFSALNTEVNV